MALRVSLGRARRLLAATVVAAAVAIVGTLAVAAPAQAAYDIPYTPVQFQFWSDSQALTVGSAALGSVVVQDTFRKDDPLQIWDFYWNGTDGSSGLVVNPTLGGCLTTFGAAGTALYVVKCDNLLGQVWTLSVSWYWNGQPVVNIYNPYYKLVVNIAGGSTQRRGVIIGWPADGGVNEFLKELPA
ncbi:MAG TPA: hypothetical protein VHA75_10615 [Rugosimonospora sp.]|nr:hypothetical protein [Rugosimonospora sp.]